MLGWAVSVRPLARPGQARELPPRWKSLSPVGGGPRPDLGSVVAGEILAAELAKASPRPAVNLASRPAGGRCGLSAA